ncbi:MAG: phenylalanine--tRNA ligase subunit beta [Corynebacteriales bacterium]|nr:phenylalanine--tRNA ligase subunit beta [Mycobacteriales bacterium]
MRVPVSWLREFINIDGYSIEELDAALIRQGLEVEQIHRPELTGPLVVGEVQKITELTEFKKPIRHCLVNVGNAQPQSIVCGARNFAEGDWVVVVLPGAVLPGNFAISARKTYGHLSEGMICSAAELGLGDDHDGIIVLDRAELDPSVQPGTNAIPMLGLDETVIELAITPDRGYCLSIRGVARELAHALNVPFTDRGIASVPAATAQAPQGVRVLAESGCARFVARAVHGFDPQTRTPQWMRTRLIHGGMRPISFTVDVTNYLMLELGQPMHAFDAAKLQGDIVVRTAQAGETLRTLDGVVRKLDPEDVLITDDSGPIGLAAVMGGATTEISESTTDVVIECANWDPVLVARTARRHKLPSEAAKRFERGVDPALAPVAAQRAVDLLCELGGATADERVLDVDVREPRAPIALDPQRPGAIAGVPYSADVVRARLQEVGCSVSGAELFEVVPPSWRSDLTDPADLVEEVIRLEGYDNIPALTLDTPPSAGLTSWQRLQRRVADGLAAYGLVEVLNYPFVSPKVYDQLGLAQDDARRMSLRLANPMAETEPELRTTMLPGLFTALRRNLGRGERDLALFEMGQVFLPRADAPAAPRLGVEQRPTDEELAALLAAVPEQPVYVAAVFAGAADPVGWWGKGRPADWSDAIAAAGVVAREAGIDFRVEAADYAPWHPGRCARFVTDAGVVVGYAGELHPSVVAACELPKRTCAMELNLNAVPLPESTSAPKLSGFPPALIDVALVVPDRTPVADVERALRAGAGDLLEALRLFDVYEGDQLGAGRKSLAFALTFRAPDRTLTVEEATNARDSAVAEAFARLGAVLRD